jgi:hypothetical protein
MSVRNAGGILLTEPLALNFKEVRPYGKLVQNQILNTFAVEHFALTLQISLCDKPLRASAICRCDMPVGYAGAICRCDMPLRYACGISYTEPLALSFKGQF